MQGLRSGKGGKRTSNEFTVIGVDDPVEIDARYRRAAFRGMWFAAAFAMVFAALAALSWAGAIGKPQDASQLLVMALGGVVLFIFSRIIIRFFAG
jgi:cytochrome c biogenesis protein CcdA